jgi:hypothetical protein
MNTERFEKLTTEQLVVEFSHVASDRGAAILDLETHRANKMFDKMQAIDRVLRSRGQDARLALSPLLDDKERSVRYYAAKYLLGLLPDQTRRVIEEIARPRFDPICTDAGMCLYALDEGIFTPD